MQCPRDATELESVTINGKSYHRCKRCEGVFFPLSGITLRGVKVENLKPKTSECIANGEGLLASPASKTAMQRFAYQGVHLDYCKALNAVWLDGGELETLATNVAAMGAKHGKSQVVDSSGSSWVSEVATEVGLEIAWEFVVGAVSCVASIGDVFD